MPKREPDSATATSRLSRAASSSDSSVSVPGVTMRVTSRSTGPLLCRRVADLLADGHRDAGAHQPREVALDRVVGHAGHRDRRAGRGAAAGQVMSSSAAARLRVVVEELVEVAHAVEQQLVRVLRLDAQVLLHHRCVNGFRSC
jgi:hypothetical protein